MRDACALEEIFNCVPDDGDLHAEREPQSLMAAYCVSQTHDDGSVLRM